MRLSTRQTKRATKSYSIERDLHSYVTRTRGSASASARVNELLRKAIAKEEEAELEKEAARFFAVVQAEERKEARAFQRAAKRTLARD